MEIKEDLFILNYARYGILTKINGIARFLQNNKIYRSDNPDLYKEIEKLNFKLKEIDTLIMCCEVNLSCLTKGSKKNAIEN